MIYSVPLYRAYHKSRHYYLYFWSTSGTSFCPLYFYLSPNSLVRASNNNRLFWAYRLDHNTWCAQVPSVSTFALLIDSKFATSSRDLCALILTDFSSLFLYSFPFPFSLTPYYYFTTSNTPSSFSLQNPHFYKLHIYIKSNANPFHPV